MREGEIFNLEFCVQLNLIRHETRTRLFSNMQKKLNFSAPFLKEVLMQAKRKEKRNRG